MATFPTSRIRAGVGSLELFEGSMVPAGRSATRRSAPSSARHARQGAGSASALHPMRS